jgi:hypothetical protein
LGVRVGVAEAAGGAEGGAVVFQVAQRGAMGGGRACEVGAAGGGGVLGLAAGDGGQSFRSWAPVLVFMGGGADHLGEGGSAATEAAAGFRLELVG